MLGSRLIETAIGLVFVFLMCSLLCSVVHELIATIMNWRAKSLRQGIGGLFGTTAVTAPDGTTVTAVQRFYDHGLIQSLMHGARLPSYIPARSFALTLLNILGIDVNANTQQILQRVDSIRDPKLKESLSALVAEAAGKATALQGSIETWFNDAMDRVSGAYKRWAQMITFVIGLALAVVLNINTIEVAGVLWNDDIVRGAVAEAADSYVKANPALSSVPAAGASGEEFAAAFSQLTDQLDALKLPVGWQGRGWPSEPSTWWILRVTAGWLLTALAVSFGAQFWFQILGDLLKLRGAGPKPAVTPSGSR